MPIVRKGHIRSVDTGAIQGQVAFIASLLGVAVSAEQEAGLHVHRIPLHVCATEPLLLNVCYTSKEVVWTRG
jgi:hypothetical protein